MLTRTYTEKDLGLKYDLYNGFERVTRGMIDERIDTYKQFGDNHSLINQIGYCYYYAGDYYNGLLYAIKGMSLELDGYMIEELFYTYRLIGDIYKKVGVYEASIEFYMKALSLEVSDIDFKEWDIYRRMALVYILTESYALAVEYGEKARRIAMDIDDLKLIGDSDLVLTRSFVKKSDTELGLKHALKAMTSYKELDDLKSLGHVYAQMSELYIQDSNPLAVDFYKKAVAMYEKTGCFARIIKLKYLAGTFYLKDGLLDSAEAVLEEGLELARKYNLISEKVELYYLLSKVYEVKGNILMAFESYKTGTKIKSSLKTDMQLARIYNMINEFNIKKIKKQADS